MSSRRLLVIGSQCEALSPPLSFLPEAAVNLDRALRGDAHGGWTGALSNGQSLLLDPSRAMMDAGISDAFRLASAAEATLLIAYVGHGEAVDEDFYLLPYDSPAIPDSQRSYLFGQRIVELLREHSGLDGLIMLVDACRSGTAASQAADRWIKTVSQAGQRFEMLTASDHRSAAGGCFTRSITRALIEGHDEFGDYIHCHDLKVLLGEACRGQVAQRIAYDGRVLTDNSDAGLWLSRNVSRVHTASPLSMTQANAQVTRLLQYYKSTDDLEQVAGLSIRHRGVLLLAPPGRGKSALLAALFRPRDLRRDISAGFVDALVFASRNNTAETLAEEIHRQLSISVQAFASAAGAFRRRCSEEVWRKLDAWNRLVVGPLTALPATARTRIAIDGLDELGESDRASVMAALTEMLRGPVIAPVRIIVSARSDLPALEGFETLKLGPANVTDVNEYLAQRGVAGPAAQTLAGHIGGNWLMARLYADYLAKGGSLNAERPARLDQLYREELELIAAGDRTIWTKYLAPVLAVLAAAGSGPVLPLRLMVDATATLNGPRTIRKARDCLVLLRGLVVRGQAGTDDEQVGLFHSTLRDYLRSSAGQELEVLRAHEALVDAIARRAPADTSKGAGRYARYAQTAEAEHLWALGRTMEAVISLENRSSRVPAEGLRSWRSWSERLKTELGEYAEATLRARRNAANSQALSGDIDAGLQLLRLVLQDDTEKLGPGHPETVRVRASIANWSGESGQVARAKDMFQDLLDSQRTANWDPIDEIRIRHGLASWTGLAGDVAGALRQFERLLPDVELLLGPTARETIQARHHVARWTGHTGQFERARALYKALVRDQRQWLDADDPEALITRDNLTYWTGRSGYVRTAIRLLEDVVADWKHAYGVAHPEALTTRHNLAYWHTQAGHAAKALELYQALLQDQLPVLGTSHPATLRSRHNIAQLIGELGRPYEAQELLLGLLTDQERALGEENPAVLRTLHSIARWKGVLGEIDNALSLYRFVLANQQAALGTAHPATYSTEQNLALWLAEEGNYADALDLMTDSVTRQRDQLGPEQLDVRIASANQAHLLGLNGQIEPCLIQLETSLEQLRIRHAHLPGTLRIRHNQALWMLRAGERAESVNRLSRLVPALQKTFGPTHPFTIKARYNLACADADIHGLRQAAAAQRAVLQPGHPDLIAAETTARVFLVKEASADTRLDTRWELIFAPDHPLPLNRRIAR